MAIYIEMPKLSDTMTEGTLLKWRKNEGDKIETGDILADIETDKATMEMEAFDDGILHKQLVAEGGKAAVGSKIGLLLQKGEAPPADGAPVAESARTTEGKADTIAPVEGAQPGAAPAKSAAPAAMPAGTGDQRIALSGMRRVIAERLLASKTTIPHFYLNIEVDAGPLMKFRAEANAVPRKPAAAETHRQRFHPQGRRSPPRAKVPAVNASFAGDAIIQYGSVNLSVAVAVDEGLVTPVIRDAQKKSLREISESVKDLATRARGKKLKPEEYAGGTITVSNLGSYGIDSFSAIINPPQALIISVGAIVKKPVVNAKNEIVVGQRMAIGLSAIIASSMAPSARNTSPSCASSSRAL
jgi:pyruvate dehydrogenase E2 component (dihydrolipoamide acetyltransferase)